MGIYPSITYKKQPDGALHQIVDEPGLKTVYVYQPVATFEFRTNCYCCSCPEDRPGGDPYCRNHGFAGTRPCEAHGMAGDRNEVTGEMPISVQEKRLKNRLPDPRKPLATWSDDEVDAAGEAIGRMSGEG